MYPALYFAHDLPFPRSHQVFVAMTFTRTEERWENVIQPAIRRVEVNGKPLEPYRVDNRQVSDSILTDILKGIAQSALVFADITALDVLNGAPIRSANVLYELGLAHAVRPPEEVVIFRSDQHPMLFDMAHIRVNSYSPESAAELAIQKVVDALINALSESEGRCRQIVKSLVAKLDLVAIGVLMDAMAGHPIAEPEMRNAGQILGFSNRRQAILRLLELGLLSAELAEWTEESLLAIDLNSPMGTAGYRITPLGRAVANECMVQWGFGKPNVKQAFETLFNKWLGEGVVAQTSRHSAREQNN